MPFVLLIFGAAFIAAGVQNKQGELYSLIKGDLTGTESGGNYLTWIVAILVIGMIGYVEDLKGISRAFMALIIVVLFLSNGGFFQKFQSQVFSSQSGGLNLGLIPNSGLPGQSTTGTIPNPFPGGNSKVPDWVNQIDPSLGVPVAPATTH